MVKLERNELLRQLEDPLSLVRIPEKYYQHLKPVLIKLRQEYRAAFKRLRNEILEAIELAEKQEHLKKRVRDERKLALPLPDVAFELLMRLREPMISYRTILDYLIFGKVSVIEIIALENLRTVILKAKGLRAKVEGRLILIHHEGADIIVRPAVILRVERFSRYGAPRLAESRDEFLKFQNISAKAFSYFAGNIYDPFNTFEDALKGKIYFLDDKRVLDDPASVLDMVLLSVVYGLEPTGETVRLAREAAPLINLVPEKLLREKFLRLFSLKDRLEEVIYLLDRIGVFETVLRVTKESALVKLSAGRFDNAEKNLALILYPLEPPKFLKGIEKHYREIARLIRRP